MIGDDTELDGTKKQEVIGKAYGQLVAGSDNEAAEAAVTILLQILIGVDRVAEPGMKDTPRRFVKALREMTAGYQESPQSILSTVFNDVEYDEVVIVRDIPFVSLCEHHLLPILGMADVGYLPGSKGVVGLSKIPRLVDCFARRFQVQERMTTQIAQSLMKCLDARGAAVVLTATHSCMSCRGVKKQGSMVTSCMLGVFRESGEARNEFLSLSKR